MNDHGQSDSMVVPKKSSNKAGKPDAEMMEGSVLTEGNEQPRNKHQTQSWGSLENSLQLIRAKAKADKEMQFTALLHHIYNLEALKAAYFNLKKDAAAGVDGQTWRAYGEKLEDNLTDLSERLKRGAYRPQPVRRVFIPKPDGKQRPLGVTALEDKIVQRATVEVLNAIFEIDFKGFSYGFRPGRSQHNALDALYVAITTKKVNWILDADIRDFFGTIDRECLIQFVERRIADKRVVRLIKKWLHAGVMDNGEIEYAEAGTPQGAGISPLLANVYLHYVYDEWILEWRKKQADGEVIVVRYADDTIVGFQKAKDADEFLNELQTRFAAFSLELHPEKTRLIEFGRFAAQNRAMRGEGKPETFTFLGFTHICGTKRNGEFDVKRQTLAKRSRAKLSEISTELRKRINHSVSETGAWLKRVVTGHYVYYAVPGNYRQLSSFRRSVIEAWHWMLNRRSQRANVSRDQMVKLAECWIPVPRIRHPYPDQRFARQHPK
jgi:RNA-directed DNA polymerase